MRIGLISDTHDNLPMVRMAVSFFTDAEVDCLIHAGDFVAPFALREVLKFPGPVHAVFGNNDGEREGLKRLLPGLTVGPLRLTLGDSTIVVVHDQDQLRRSDVDDADVIVVGHTHEADIREDTPLVVNPGECAGWVTGKCTVATLDPEALEAEIIHLSGP